jgi:hypothetical protein
MLIKIDNQRLIKPISENWAMSVKEPGGLTKYEILAAETTAKELTDMLGAAFVYDIDKNQTAAKYVDILDGKEFTDSNTGSPVKFQGIRYILAYFIYSKYAGVSHVEDTFSGMVSKNRNEAVNISAGDMKQIRNDAQAVAFADFKLLQDFLNQNNDLYPLWNCAPLKQPFSPKITTIRKTFN